MNPKRGQPSLDPGILEESPQLIRTRELRRYQAASPEVEGGMTKPFLSVSLIKIMLSAAANRTSLRTYLH